MVPQLCFMQIIMQKQVMASWAGPLLKLIRTQMILPPNYLTQKYLVQTKLSLPILQHLV